MVLEDRRCKAQERNIGKKAHTVGALKHREFRALVGSQPACAAWQNCTTLRGFCITDRHQSLWCQPMLMVFPWLPAAEGANARRLVLPVTRKQLRRP